MNTQENKKIPSFLFWLSLLCANGAIIISLMHLVFHFICTVNFAVAFLDSEVTSVLMIILSAFSMIASACVMIILHRTKNNSYFFRKVAFITFWLCFLNILFQRNVILPNMVETYHRNMLWFFISVFTMINSVFCNGLLCMNQNQTPKATENK